MRAWLRQQVGPPQSIHPPCRSSSNIRYPRLDTGRSDVVTDAVALPSKSDLVSVLENASEISSDKRGQCLFTSLPAPVTSPLRQLKKDRTWRHCIQISVQGRLCISALVYWVRTCIKCLLWRHWYNISNSVGKPSCHASINTAYLMHCWQVLLLHLGSICGWFAFY